MEPFVRHEGIVAPINRVNVDTDQIIPKQFLKRIERTGFGQFLFNDWRFNEDGSNKPDFILNKPGYEGASILVAGRNFGSGSSREHAPLGAARLRLPLHHRAELRRHILQQLLPERRASSSSAGGCRGAHPGKGGGVARLFLKC